VVVVSACPRCGLERGWSLLSESELLGVAAEVLGGVDVPRGSAVAGARTPDSRARLAALDAIAGRVSGPLDWLQLAARHPSDRPGGEGIMAIQCGKRGCKQWGSGDRSSGGAVISRFGLAPTMPH
jgi:hypothetical protein